MSHPAEQLKHIADAASITVWVGAMLQWLPAIAALVSIVWGCIRIYETHTVQRLLGKAHRRRNDPEKAHFMTDCKYYNECKAKGIQCDTEVDCIRK